MAGDMPVTRLAILQDLFIFLVFISHISLSFYCLLSVALSLDVPVSQQALALFTGFCSKSLINLAPGS